jgi:hypothetical protein
MLAAIAASCMTDHLDAVVFMDDWIQDCSVIS